MFQFPGLPPPALYIRAGAGGHSPAWVPPFGNPRVKGQMRLTAAYRSWSRPSSASCAKASTVRPWYLLPRAPREGPRAPLKSYHLTDME